MPRHPCDEATSVGSASLNNLRTRLIQAAAPARGRIGAAVALLGTDGAAAIAADERFPMHVAVMEKEMGRDPEAQYQNWATPAGAVSLLRALDEGRGLGPENRQHLLWLLQYKVDSKPRSGYSPLLREKTVSRSNPTA